MKRILTIISLLTLLVVGLLAQEKPEPPTPPDRQEIEEQVKEIQRLKAEIEAKKENIHHTITVGLGSDDPRMESPYMGIYTDDITLNEAREMGYEENYGILITGVASNSPARLYRLLKGDILMKIGDNKILDGNSLTSVIASYYVGDTVPLTVFRNGKTMTIDFTFGRRGEKIDMKDGKVIVDSEEEYYSVGDGGGSWIPVYFMPEMDDLNYLVQEFGFSKLREDGMLLNGFGGKGNVSGGWFMGGMGVWGGEEKKTDHQITLEDNSVVNTVRRLDFTTYYWGLTLDRRFALSHDFIMGLGFMIGGGGYELDISQSDGDYNWEHLEDDFDDPLNNHVTLCRDYIVFQPKAMLMYRILDWLSIRAEAGYMMGYALNETWQVEMTGDAFEVTNSPETPFEGMTVTIGPWFGF